MIDSGGHLPFHPAMGDSPNLTPSKRTEQTERAERLARALRENLHRRKAQARAKEAPSGNDPAGQGDREPPA